MSNKNLFYDDGSFLKTLGSRPIKLDFAGSSNYIKFFITPFGSAGLEFLSSSYHIITNSSSFYQGLASNALAAYLQYGFNTDYQQSFISIYSSIGRLLLITDHSNYNQNHDHGIQTNPTLFVHSATAPNTDNTQWIGLTHDQTNGVISVGKGLLKLSAPLGVVNEAVAGDTLLSEANTERNVTGGSYSMVKEIRVPRPGTYRIKFDMINDAGGYDPFARIYRNGVAVGTEQTETSTSYATKSEDIAGWAANDLLQLYVTNKNDGSTAGKVKNLKVYEAVTATATVNTD